MRLPCAVCPRSPLRVLQTDSGGNADRNGHARSPRKSTSSRLVESWLEKQFAGVGCTERGMRRGLAGGHPTQAPRQSARRGEASSPREANLTRRHAHEHVLHGLLKSAHGVARARAERLLAS